MAKKRVISSDIDGVITEFVAPFTDFINSKLGTNHDYQQQYHVDIAKSYSLESDVVNRLHEEFVADGHYRRLPFVDGAIEALTRLSDKYEIILITSRRDDLVTTTRDWCSEHLPQVRLLFARGKGNAIAAGTERRNKEDIAEELGAICLIEDNPHELVDWNKPTIQPICFARNQNEWLSQAHPHIPRLDWSGIIQMYL